MEYIKYSIFGLDHKKLSEMRVVNSENGTDKEMLLSIADVYILKELADFIYHPKVKKIEIEGRQYSWISYRSLLAALPLLRIDKRSLALHVDKLASFGLIEKIVQKDEGGTLTLFRMTEKYSELVYTQAQEGGCQKIDTPCQKISNGGAKKLATGVLKNLQPNIINSIDNNKENIERKEIIKEKKLPDDKLDGNKKPDFKALFIEQAKKMETDENLQMSLAYLKITNFKELANQFYRHIINTVQQAKFIQNGYTNNCRWLKYVIPDLDLSKARGKELGPGEMIDDDGNRYYINQWSGTKIIVPDDAPPRPSKNHIWARSEGCWITN